MVVVIAALFRRVVFLFDGAVKAGKAAYLPFKVIFLRRICKTLSGNNQIVLKEVHSKKFTSP
jgi:hypothetical protein